jgi:hypothetical protein
MEFQEVCPFSSMPGPLLQGNASFNTEDTPAIILVGVCLVSIDTFADGSTVKQV